MPQMVTVGLSFGSHDAAAAVSVGTRLVAAAEEERFNRQKHTRAFPSGAIQSCLRTAGLDTKDIDNIAVFLDRRLLWLLPLYNLRAAYPEGLLYMPHAMKWAWRRFRSAKVIRSSGIFQTDCPICFIPHHLAHAASAYLLSPFRHSTVVTIDGRGEFETACIFEGRDNSLHLKHRITYPHSLGYLYSAVTRFLGFHPQSDEYKVMGLAAYGTPTLISRANRLARFDGSSGCFALNLDYFDHHRTSGSKRMLFSDSFVSTFGPPRRPSEPLEQRHADLAFAIQHITEELMCEYVRFATRLVGSRNVCMAGGVALNCVANSAIAQLSEIDQLYVPSAPHDAGAAVGAALLRGASHPADASPKLDTHPFLGPEFSDTEIGMVLSNLGDEFVVRQSVNPAIVAAQMLRANRIIAWFQGRMEFGPRALGARSILASPIERTVKDHINHIIKQREGFRPFGAAALDSDASQYFRLVDSAKHLYPLMLATAVVRSEVRDKIPAVVHADGSCRIQTVSRATSPVFGELLERCRKETGIGVVLNTSFNIAGEPIVCTPLDAVRTFVRSGLDAMFIGTWIVERRRTGAPFCDAQA